ncbi:hypothetical protein FA13DRAFT_1713557 [Coprinellus micaceus]|uniref:Uncharacterized protein n=1 Tax=Coprinellus micaceus TaxID=71717 RepID=A0A4Y7SVK2_COPMI|nr:hypothetical protein FA13DRAFT_1713557 [Coprinellus micaceus]
MGRPRKYHSEEERRAAVAAQSKKYYDNNTERVSLARRTRYAATRRGAKCQDGGVKPRKRSQQVAGGNQRRRKADSPAPVDQSSKNAIRDAWKSEVEALAMEVNRLTWGSHVSLYTVQLLGILTAGRDMEVLSSALLRFRGLLRRVIRMEIELGKVYGAGNTDPLVDLQLVLKPEVLLIVDNLQAIETRLARGDTLELILEFATRHLEKWDSGEIMPLSTNDVCELMVGNVIIQDVVQRAIAQRASPTEASREPVRERVRLTAGSDDSASSDSVVSEEVIRTKFDAMYNELTRKPSDEDLIALAKAQIRNEWFTDDGITFPRWVFHEPGLTAPLTETGLPAPAIPTVNLSFLLLAAEEALRDLVHKRTLFDSLLLPQLQTVLQKTNLSEEEKVHQLVFLRHHNPVALRSKIGQLNKPVPFEESFVYEWELYREDESDRLVNKALESLGL